MVLYILVCVWYTHATNTCENEIETQDWFRNCIVATAAVLFVIKGTSKAVRSTFNGYTSDFFFVWLFFVIGKKIQVNYRKQTKSILLDFYSLSTCFFFRYLFRWHAEHIQIFSILCASSYLYINCQCLKTTKIVCQKLYIFIQVDIPFLLLSKIELIFFVVFFFQNQI